MIHIIPENRQSPRFSSTLKNLSLVTGTPFMYRLPSIFDIDDDGWTVKAYLGTAEGFISF